MSAFDGKNRIARMVVDPTTDHTLPNSKSLSWKAITTPVALSGTKGAHCELVHGDKWRELKGNHTENIGANQTIKVVGDHKETLVGKVYQNIIGPHIVSNQTVRNETRMGAYSEVYGDLTRWDDANGDMLYCDTLYHHTNIFDFEYCTSKVEVTPVHLEVKAAHLALSLVEAQASWVNLQNATLDVELFTTAGQISAFNFNSDGVKVHATTLQKFWVGVTQIIGGTTAGPNSIL